MKTEYEKGFVTKQKRLKKEKQLARKTLEKIMDLLSKTFECFLVSCIMIYTFTGNKIKSEKEY